MSPRFVRASKGAAAVAVHEASVAVLGEALTTLDASGAVAIEAAAPKGARRFARGSGAWLVACAGGKSLARIAPSGQPGRRASGPGARALAKGTGAVADVATSGEQVAVARASGLELWSDAGAALWTRPTGAFVGVAFAGEHVLGLDEAGALVFCSRERGEVAGTLRLASPEDVATWRLVGLGAGAAVLALGEWLVWVDPRTRKTIRRVRARAKVRALAADGAWLVAGCEDGWVQAFRAGTGEASASFQAHDVEIASLAVGDVGVFTLSASGEVRGWPLGVLEAATRVASPVTALAARADVAVAADGDGRVRIMTGGHAIASLEAGQAPLAAFVDRDEAVVVATSRVVLRAAPPWHAPKPFALRAPATAAAADDAYVFVGTATGGVDVFDLGRGAFVTSYALSDAEVSALCRLPGALLVVGTGALDGRVLVVDVEAPKVVHRIEAHEDAFGVTCLAADPRGRIVASGSDGGDVVLVDPARGRALLRVELRETPVAIAFDATGRRFAAVLADGRLSVITLGSKGAVALDAGLRDAVRVAWGAGEPLVGFRDGRVARLSGLVEASRSSR